MATNLRYRPVEEKAAIIADVVVHLWPLIESGGVRPIVHETVPMERAADAHRIMESGPFGKVLLVVG
jgi:NADPH:quinone reductase-like Zn-dependent oxidoreductase